MVRKTHFTTSSQEKNTPQEADVSLSKSGANKARLCKNTYKKQDHLWKNILWMAATKINLYQNDGKKKVWRRFETAYDAKHTTSYVKHGGSV